MPISQFSNQVQHIKHMQDFIQCQSKIYIQQGFIIFLRACAVVERRTVEQQPYPQWGILFFMQDLHVW